MKNLKKYASVALGGMHSSRAGVLDVTSLLFFQAMTI